MAASEREGAAVEAAAGAGAHSFEPRLTELSAGRMLFIGLERADSAWVLQEWDCELP